MTPRNRLTSKGGTTIAYDPLGRLWQTSGGASGTTRFLYDGDQLVAEYDASGTLTNRYVFGPGVDEPVMTDAGGAMNCTGSRFPNVDERGSIIAAADCGGVRRSIDSYDEYGVPAAGNTGRFQYTGQAWLPDVGLYYYKSRFYNPAIGRFMQTDPIGYGDGLNWYNYVGGDPINKRDPFGLSSTLPYRTCNDGSIQTDCSGHGGVMPDITVTARVGHLQSGDIHGASLPKDAPNTSSTEGPDIIVRGKRLTRCEIVAS